MTNAQSLRLAERAVHGVLARRRLATVGMVSEELNMPASTTVAVLNRLLDSQRVFRQEITTGRRGRPSYRYGLRLAKPIPVIHWDGTQVTGAIVDRDSALLATEVVHAPVVKSVDEAAGLAAVLLSTLIARCGTVRTRLGRLVLSVNAVLHADGGLSSSVLPWVDERITETFSKHLHLPVRLMAPPMLLAEYQFLGSSAPDSLAYLHAGDGVSGRFTALGQVVHGHTEWAGQLGHVTRDPAGLRCGCGRRGCLETLCSGPAIARVVRERAARRGAARWLKEAAVTRSVRAMVEQVWENWSKKDSQAHDVMEPVLDHLAWGVGLLVNMLDPETVVAGGYVLQGRPAWIDELRQRSRGLIVGGVRRTIDLRSGQVDVVELLRTAATVSENA